MRKKASRSDSLSKKTLLSVLKKGGAEVLEVLDRHGVHFCAGCYLTFSSPVEKAAAYHAVPDTKKLLKELARALSRKP